MVARRAHNPKVVGSNPAPATNTLNTLTGVFVSVAHKKALFSAFLLSPSRQRRPIGKIGFNPCQNRLCNFLLEGRRFEFALFLNVTDKCRFDQNGRDIRRF